MNIFTRMFGSDRVIGKAVDGVYNGVDSLVYTNEEKAERFERLLKLYEPFKLAQRLLALTFCIPYAAAWILTFILSLFGVDPKDQLQLLNGDIGEITKMVAIFYFGGGAINTLAGLKK